MKENKKSIFSIKSVKIIVFTSYFILGCLYAYYMRKYSKISSKLSAQIIFLDAFFLTLISICLLPFSTKNRNTFNFLVLFTNMTMFFFSSKLYMNCVSQLSAFVITIFCQSRVIVTCLYSIIILSSKILVNEIFGVFLISFAMIAMSYNKDDKVAELKRPFDLKLALFTSLSSSLSGLSSCIFDSHIKPFTPNFSKYSLQSNLIYLLISFLYHIYQTISTDISVFDSFNEPKLYFLAIISTLISLLAMLNCFCFNAVERMLMSLLSKLVSDIVIDVLYEYKFSFILILCYFSVILGTFFYKLNEIIEYFRSSKNK